MGFSITPLAQKARTQTLIIDSDLDMGQYDVVATDVKGDTAEFSEFVGGVGNFTTTLTRGNAQVDGNIILEGSINNVNINDDGIITTSKSVTALNGFNGNLIGNATSATSLSAHYNFNGANASTSSPTAVNVAYPEIVAVLPMINGVLYSGVVSGFNRTDDARGYITYLTEAGNIVDLPITTATENYTLNRIKALWFKCSTAGYALFNFPIITGIRND